MERKSRRKRKRKGDRGMGRRRNRRRRKRAQQHKQGCPTLFPPSQEIASSLGESTTLLCSSVSARAHKLAKSWDTPPLPAATPLPTRCSRNCRRETVSTRMKTTSMLDVDSEILCALLGISRCSLPSSRSLAWNSLLEIDRVKLAVEATNAMAAGKQPLELVVSQLGSRGTSDGIRASEAFFLLPIPPSSLSLLLQVFYARVHLISSLRLV